MKYKKMSELCEVKGGKRLPKGEVLIDTPTDYRYLRISDYKDGYFDTKNIKFITSETHEKIKNYLIFENDVFVSIVGTIGIVSLIDVDLDMVHLTENAVRINSLDKNILNNEYLFYYLRSEIGQNEMRMRTVGSTQPKLAITRIKDIPVLLPEMSIQKQIINILNSLDSKINNNRLIIGNLEELSQTLFKHWFINFEFPNEVGLPYKSSGGKMVESELGDLPEGWSVEYLSYSTEFLSGGTPKTNESSYWNGDIPFFTPKDVGSSAYSTNTEKTITDLGLSKCNSKLYQKNTVFITARGTVGKVALANRDMAMNQSCFALKSKYNTQLFLFGVVQMLLREIIQGATGAVFNAINLADLNRLQVKIPPIELIRHYEDIVTPLFDQMSELEFENIKLKNIRDSLLPRLLSGEIEIRDESVVG